MHKYFPHTDHDLARDARVFGNQRTSKSCSPRFPRPPAFDREYDLPPAMSELELTRVISRTLSKLNRHLDRLLRTGRLRPL
ncbi:MAG: hypothetical protein MZU97_00905 [Bacillus subtilis]|nr:hypothetical protein [Bacillus subtilis]